MKLSTRSTYGLRAMMAVANDAGNGTVMVKEIAERHNLPATYLEQIMVPLRKAGLLSATRGARGGHRLSRPAREITVCEIIETLEGPLELVDCAEISSCDAHPDICAMKDVLNEASAALRNVLAKVTLDELVKRQQTKAEDSVLMFMI